MTALTVDQARQMGHEGRPLRIDAINWVVVVRRNYTIDGGLVAQVEVQGETVARLDFIDSTQLVVHNGRIVGRGGSISVDTDAPELIGAWLSGYAEFPTGD